MRRQFFPQIGDRFGRLVVLALGERKKAGQPTRSTAVCTCDCGSEVEVLLQNLKGRTRSCGCLKRKGSMSEAFRVSRNTPRRRPKTHGLSKHPSYFRWHNAMSRCTNPNHKAYPDYGGRGISIHAPWLDAAVFLTWLDDNLGPCPEGLSLDRIDNDGNYEPGNLRWATRSQQVKNRRPRRAE